MRRFLLFLLSILVSSCVFCQNLLVNGGFEDENICTEFHVNCAPEGWISTADTYNNFFKIPGLAHRGQHCIAIEAGHSKKQFTRTYIRSQLLCRLRKGKKYRIEFYIKSRHNILDSVGIYFTSYDFLFEKQVRNKIIPSLYVADAAQKPMRNDTNWQKVSIEYSATGKELYMTLGNFSKGDITGATGVYLENHFFVFFDDVTLLPEDQNEKICDSWQKTKDEIYAFDPRHDLVDLYVKTYMKNPPDPPDIERTILQTIDTLILHDVLFATDQSELSRKSFRLLDSMCNSLSNKRIDSIVVEGHTDSTGTTLHNEKLSVDRAASVGNYLQSKQLMRQPLILARGFGSEKPVADNHTTAGRQLNRRVEIFIYIRQ
jgi:outer membrane protein OmpA-like peptidoglycan-associated protein